MKNWFGIEPHITDTYIPRVFPPPKEAIEKSTKLRNAYDAIKSAGMKEELDILLGAAYESGHDSGYDAGVDDWQTG